MLLELTDALTHQGDSRPFKISGNLPEGSLPEDIKIVSPVTVSGTMTAIGHDIAIVGEISAQAQTNCALCLKPMDILISCEYNELLRRQGFAGDDEEEDEVIVQEAVYFDGSACDLSESAAYAVLLQLSMRYVCSEECKGLCPKCGADLNVQPCDCDRYENSPFSALASLFKEEE